MEVGKLRRMSSNSSGIAKTSAALLDTGFMSRTAWQCFVECDTICILFPVHVSDLPLLKVKLGSHMMELAARASFPMLYRYNQIMLQYDMAIRYTLLFL